MNPCACGRGTLVAKRFKRGHGRTLSESDFWNRVTKTDSCWLYNGCKISIGYGNLSYKGKATTSHRLSWELVNGSIPIGMRVLHKCDVPSCVNPDHLFLGTQSDNINDAIQKGRFKPPPNSYRLREEYIPAIRCMAGEGFSLMQIARQFDVGKSTIQRVLTGVCWKHA